MSLVPQASILQSQEQIRFGTPTFCETGENLFGRVWNLISPSAEILRKETLSGA
jgi:hypothetical protein